jgi:methyl-accepting chemotaxis protein
MSAKASGKPDRSRFNVTDLSVRTRILSAVAIASLVALAVGVTGLAELSNASAEAQRISSNVTSTGSVGDMKAAMLQARLDMNTDAVALTAAGRATSEAAFTRDLQTVDASFTAYTHTKPAGDPAVLQDLQTTWHSYGHIATDKQIPDAETGDVAAWQATGATQVTPLITKAFNDIDLLASAEHAGAARSAASARSGFESSRITATVLLVVGLLLAAAVGLLVAGQVIRSLRRVELVCDALAANDLTRTAGLTSRDEPGRMGQALDTAICRLRQAMATIDGSASSLAGAAEQMSTVSAQMAASAEETSVQAQTVSAASEQISRSVSTVSAGSEEMGASIREISQNASEAAQVASEAVKLAGATSTRMTKLGESSLQIGNVIKVITAIAEQTNLLALNATIEAARAGDAGKGFAVVASEVKDLAQETARATEDISGRVEAIQSDTGGAVSAIEQITSVIARISDYQTTIASAVEEQTATTVEMNRSVTEAATGTGEIAENITGVAHAAQLTSEGVTQTRQATAELTRMSSQLSTLLSEFKY